MISKNILAFGEILWDLLPDGAVLGGAPFNFTARVHSLGHRARMISRLGRDDLGRRAFDQATELGLDAGLVQWDDGKPTGTVPIKLDAAGVPDFNILPDVAYDRIELTDDLLRAAGEADCFCFGTLVQRTPHSRATLYALLDAASRSVKLLDINLRRDCYSPETVKESLRRADALKLNEDEVRYVAEQLELPAVPLPDFAARVIDSCELRLCIITLGAKGVFAANGSGQYAYEPGRDVPVKDTCGSGDGLTAAFLDAHLQGKTLGECCRIGNAMGSLVATQAGATEPVSRERIAEFLANPGTTIIEPALEAFRV
ncbi:MAG: hypothetical protein KDM81_01075 [Verrucomicrobiae bacterium]|nr:hypothetical protein [Verrucomicrobiae bacterium]MCP5515666.1 hypothetical protein [Verrucomicrobiales bacterium]MCP5522695.1 hypothetical protein [Verrucomicrobiales bacterium]